eukprot:CAMPEP_0175924730 /NCGR_PEP_ID=MMETSP0108-20121206/15270_1 /TAXON_ID=195067 ORGANISM="Goniomonas pacifica, Strain CCMP1869" /NCGR_SAMPLE_ID=MMETSP0108 /ASSEMBLY_ACC=CAM_ASM_000204 /LENGTH=233 /DNA_ID=CAMNT_0017247837 /DNA_START=137 /DNA_END=836 /DNA_ORIENTATION=+
MSSCDPGDVFDTIDRLKEAKIRCSVVGLSAELFVCHHLATTTRGTYGISLNPEHYTTLLMKHTQPHPTAADATSGTCPVQPMRMGFPSSKNFTQPTMCSCHLEPRTHGHHCPRCSAIVCELPCSCPICELKLVASSHLLGRSITFSRSPPSPTAPFRPHPRKLRLADTAVAGVLSPFQRPGSATAVAPSTATSVIVSFTTPYMFVLVARVMPLSPKHRLGPVEPVLYHMGILS